MPITKPVIKNNSQSAATPINDNIPKQTHLSDRAQKVDLQRVTSLHATGKSNKVTSVIWPKICREVSHFIEVLQHFVYSVMRRFSNPLQEIQQLPESMIPQRVEDSTIEESAKAKGPAEKSESPEMIALEEAKNAAEEAQKAAQKAANSTEYLDAITWSKEASSLADAAALAAEKAKGNPEDYTLALEFASRAANEALKAANTAAKMARDAATAAEVVATPITPETPLPPQTSS